MRRTVRGGQLKSGCRNQPLLTERCLDTVLKGTDERAVEVLDRRAVAVVASGLAEPSNVSWGTKFKAYFLAFFFKSLGSNVSGTKATNRAIMQPAQMRMT